jgi:hypothetical protein
MPARIIKLILLFSVVALCIYFVSINNSSVTVAIAPGNSITASVGTLVLGAFAFGIFLAFVAASVFALRSFFREQGFKRREKKRLKIDESIIEAREIAKTEDLNTSRKKWRSILAQNQDSLAVHLQYCEFLLNSCDSSLPSDLNLAVAAIDEAKKLFPDSIEVHLLASRAQNLLGNKTASLDNLAVVLSKKTLLQPTLDAAQLSYELNRFEDCFEYIERAHELAPANEKTVRLRSDALAGIIIRDKYQDDEKRTALINHLVSHPQSCVALRAVAELQLNAGMVKDSAESLWRLFKITSDISDLRKARSVWLSGGYVENAIAAVKTFARDSKEEQAWLANLELAKTYLLVGQDMEASNLIEKLQTQPYSSNINNAKEIAILKAMIAYRARDAHASALAFQTVERLELGVESMEENHKRLAI